METYTLIKLSEVFLKSKRTQKDLFKILKKNIESLGLELFRKRTRLFVKGFDPKLKNVFGIESIAQGVFTNEPTKYILKIIKDQDFNTFKVKVKRHDKTLPYTSIDYSKYFGEEILKRVVGKKVDLKNPDLIVNIEIFGKNDFFVYFNEIKCYGGLPLGSQGKGLCLISTGIDSPVAAFLMMKRGVALDFVHFKIGDQNIERVFNKIKEFSIGYKPKLYIIDHEEFLKKYKNSKYICVLCKRRMLKKACELAKEKGYKTIVTGDNLGQVATQTLDNLSVIDKVSDVLVLRPLIGFNKQEIIDISKKIGLYDVFENKECSYLPKKVCTKCDLKTIKKLELGFELYLDGKEIIPEIKFKTIKEIFDFYELNPEEYVILKNNEIVLLDEEINENDKIELVSVFSKG